MTKLSVVSPVYCSSGLVCELVERTASAVKEITNDFEIILVEDGSPEDDWRLIEDCCSKYKQVRGVKLSRNFGQHYAITAGLAHARGEWVIVMDCDLQDSPEEIPNLYNKAIEGFDLVFAKRKARRDPLIKRLTSKAFYSVLSFLTNSPQDHSIANFGIYNTKVIEAVLSMKDQSRFFPTMAQWVGFKNAKIYVTHVDRISGRSSYSMKKLFNLAIDNIIAFSNKPMLIAVRVGLIVSVFSFAGGVFYLYLYLNGEITVLGFTSLIISISFFSGIIILILGIIGLYISKIFDKVKDRPLYIIDKIINER